MGGTRAPVSKWWRTLALVAVTALIAVPLGAWGSHVFTDVPNDHTFHNDIAAIADVGVTRGCNPPANTEYCPEDNVTRGQMAAFMNRLGALSGGTPVVNAATVEGWGADELGRVAYSSTEPGEEGPAMTGSGPVETTSITAPRPGFLVINGRADVNNFLESGGAVCDLTVRTPDMPAEEFFLVSGSTSFVQHDPLAVTDGGEPVGFTFMTEEGEEFVQGVNMEEDCISSGVISVAAGDYEVIYSGFGPETTEWWWSNLQVQYVPFDGQGNPPSAVELQGSAYTFSQRQAAYSTFMETKRR